MKTKVLKINKDLVVIYCLVCTSIVQSIAGLTGLDNCAVSCQLLYKASKNYKNDRCSTNDVRGHSDKILAEEAFIFEAID